MSEMMLWKYKTSVILPIILKISLLNKIACYKVSIKKGMKIWTIQIKDAMKYIEVFVRSYYERTDKGWQVVALYKRIFI